MVREIKIVELSQVTLQTHRVLSLEDLIHIVTEPCQNILFCIHNSLVKLHTCFSPEVPLLYVVARVELHASEYQGT